jgi:hypothetical protein
MLLNFAIVLSFFFVAPLTHINIAQGSLWVKGKREKNERKKSGNEVGWVVVGSGLSEPLAPDWAPLLVSDKWALGVDVASLWDGR